MSQLIEKTEIDLIVSQSGVKEETGIAIKNAFSEIETKLSEWKEKVALIKVTDASQIREMKLARETRLALKDVRIDADKIRKALKENNTKENRAIQDAYNYIESEIKPMEEHCLLQEKFAELQEQKRLEERKSKRLEELMPYNVAVDMAMIESMGEESWDMYFAGVKKTHEEAILKQQQEEKERIESEKKAEQERIERERQDKLAEERKNQLIPYWQFVPDAYKATHMGMGTEMEFQSILEEAKKTLHKFELERERQRKENERLKKEAEEKEKALAIEREKARKEKEDADRKLAEEKAKQDAENKRIQEENQAKLDAERKERERVEAELKKEKERIEKQEQERILEEQRRNAAPDKEKLQELVINLRKAELPVVTTEKAKSLIANIKVLIEKIAVYAENGIKEL
jgi:hypothetical protein